MVFVHFVKVKMRKHRFFILVSLILIAIFYSTYQNNQHTEFRKQISQGLVHLKQQYKDKDNHKSLNSELGILGSTDDIVDNLDDSGTGTVVVEDGDQAKGQDNDKSSYKLNYEGVLNQNALPVLGADAGNSREEHGFKNEAAAPVKKLPRDFRYPAEKIKEIPTIDFSKSRYSKIQASEFEENDGVKDSEKLDKIREVFVKSWKNYRKFASDYDEILPLTNEPRNPFVGWSITLIDSIDTLYLMGLKEDFEFAVNKISQINFRKSPRDYIPVFETVIRALGGLISGYDLSKDARLLAKSVECADMLIGIFDTPNNMPLLYYRWSDEDTKVPKFASKKGSVAEFGTLLMEFTRMAQITGNSTYYHYVQHITDEVEKFMEIEKSAKPDFELNGLLPTHMDLSGCKMYKDPEIADGENQSDFIKAWNDNQEVLCQKQPIQLELSNTLTYTLGGLADSFYEYLIKEYHMFNGQVKQYLDLFRKGSSKIKKHLLFKAKLPSILLSESLTVPHLKTDPDDVVFLGELSYNQEQNTIHQKTWITHLSCFAGGMFGLSSRIEGDEKELRLAKQITNGCYKIYELMELMPEWIIVEKCPSGTTEDDPECKFDSRERVKKIRMKSESMSETDLDSDDKLVKDMKFHNDRKIQKSPKFKNVEEKDEDVDEKQLAKSLNVHKKNFDQVNKGTGYEKVIDNIDDKLKKFPKKPAPDFGAEYPVTDSDLPSEQLLRNTRGTVFWPVDGKFNLPLWANNADGKFILRPELIESIFYMYRITGDLEWREKGWKLFESTIKHASIDHGVSSLVDVTNLYTPLGKINRGNRKNTLESFWFAETLKYYYLLFEDKDVWSLDDWVFNTEAHPFKRQNYVEEDSANSARAESETATSG